MSFRFKITEMVQVKLTSKTLKMKRILSKKNSISLSRESQSKTRYTHQEAVRDQELKRQSLVEEALFWMQTAISMKCLDN